MKNLAFRFRLAARIITPFCLLAVAGCGGGPSAVTQPSINAAEAGKKAMEIYDTDGNGVVSGAELDKAPALKAALENLDTNGDGGVSAEEVTARVNSWKESKVGTLTLRCEVVRNGQPLEGALVVFEPEEFLGDDIQAAQGEVSLTGLTSVRIPKEKRPTKDYPGGAQLGLYKVKITMPGNEGAIPAKYNTETILGQEVALDDPRILNNRVIYDLSN